MIFASTDKEFRTNKRTDGMIIYEPNSRSRLGLFGVWRTMAADIYTSRDLIAQMFKRDFFGVYKKSFLGIAWVFITPLLAIVSWLIMNATGILKPGDVGIPYPAYVLLSSTIYGMFMGFYMAALGTLDAGAGFIMQVKYPHEAFLIKQVAQYLANFIMSFAVAIAALLIFRIIPHWQIIFFPLFMLPFFLLGSAIGLVMTVVNVVAVEATRVMNIVLGLIIYITPVIYAPSVENPVLQKIIAYNPLTYFVGFARDMIVYGKAEHFDRYLIASLASLVLFLAAWNLFYVSEDKVIEKMI
ncbi:MAG: ABC transporter permease [Spirochaetota bacterium]